MVASAVFPGARLRAGMYESFYLRAFSPDEPLGLWIRYTVHKPPGRRPRGSLWCTLFDARRPRPFMHKLTSEQLSVPAGGWIEVAGATLGPHTAAGACGEATWALRFSTSEPELHHLRPEWLYRAPLPRTKLTSPAPGASFDGVFALAGEEAIDVSGWQGMVGHNWGAEHAERWIWLHGAGFEQDPAAWLDVALGRLKIAGRMTPWVANGVLSLGGRRHRLGGLAARDLQVQESAQGCTMRLPGGDGLVVDCRATVPPSTSAGWRYADPDGGEHHVLNCSIAALELTVAAPPEGHPRMLSTAHGCAYELGVREHDHGVALAPFPDG
jgi:hypothetical protein